MYRIYCNQFLQQRAWYLLVLNKKKTCDLEFDPQSNFSPCFKLGLAVSHLARSHVFHDVFASVEKSEVRAYKCI